MPQTAALKFFHNNMLQSTSGSLVATSTSTGAYAIDNIHNMLEVNRWKASSSAAQLIDFDAGVGNSFDANYVIIHGHNLFSGGGSTIFVSHSTSGAFAGEQVDVFSTTVPDDKTFLKEFSTQGARRYWRVTLVGQTTAVFTDIISLGAASTIAFIQPPFDPYGQIRKANTNVTQGGFVAGVHTKYIERDMSLTFPNASTSLYSILKNWWETSGGKNFFMAWDSTGDATAVYLVRPDMNFQNPINVDKFRTISINLKGRKA